MMHVSYNKGSKIQKPSHQSGNIQISYKFESDSGSSKSRRHDSDSLQKRLKTLVLNKQIGRIKLPKNQGGKIYVLINKSGKT